MLKEFELYDTYYFGKRVKKLCIDHDITYGQLAKEMALTQPGLYQKFNRHTWSLRDLYNVARVFNIEPRDLL